MIFYRRRAKEMSVGRLTELADKVNVDARLSEDGETALHRAASGGHVQAVKLLLDRGAKVDAMDGEGVTRLVLASYRGQTEAVKLLLERGADVNAREKRNGLSSLSHAVGRGDKELVRVLLLGPGPTTWQRGLARRASLAIFIFLFVRNSDDFTNLRVR